MDNSSLLAGESVGRQLNDRILILQILVAVFFCINVLLIVTFFQKECFYTVTRYILFAVALLSDSLILTMSNIMIIMIYFRFSMPIGLCFIFCFVLSMYSSVTPVTLTAMTLERYVAICMPLRHAELCTARSALHGVLIILLLSLIPCSAVMFVFLSSVSLSFFTPVQNCAIDTFLIHTWQDHVRSAIYQLYFFVMFTVLIFAYVRMIKVAKAASGENKKATRKGLRTVVLHGFQLLLCLIRLWCPFIEFAVFQIDLALFINVRYFNYIFFQVAPTCLSPLIYGLRDEKFFHSLKNDVLYGLFKRNH
ncbi:odorant receptor 131-2-like [Brachyistius frenatus]|uniref:odorant receptor 131-2-like n=1 Tax=Brachyistius frenatus TaxID=100188 RepID=UPI0037E7447D